VTKASYAVLIACVIAHFLSHFYSGALSPLFPSLDGINGIQLDLNLNLTEIGIVSSGAILMMTLFHLAIGYLGDKGWRNIFIPLSVLGPSIIILITSYATGFFFILTTQLVLGISLSPLHPSMFPALSERFPKRTRATAVGILAAGGLVGMVVVPFLGSALFAIFSGWRQSLFIMGLIGLVLLIPTILFMKYASSYDILIEKENGGNKQKLPDEGRPEGWTKDYYLLIGYVGLRGIPFRCATLLMPTYLALRFNQDALVAGTLTSIMLAAGLAAELIFAPISDRTERRTPFMVLSMILLAPFLLLLNFNLDPTILLIVLMGVGFTYFLGVPAGQAYETEIVPTKSQGLAFGVLFSLGALPGAISPFFFGYIGDTFGLEASILFLTITAILGALVAMQLKDSFKDNQKIVLGFDTQ
jgi:MFS family permease